MEIDVYEKMDLTMFYAGFGRTGNKQVKTKMKNKQVQAFEVEYLKTYNDGKANALCYFNKSDLGKTYFNKYLLTVTADKSAPRRQTFYQSYPVKATADYRGGRISPQWINSSMTLKEGYNLLRGRSVLKDFVTKDGEKYSAWARLDFDKQESLEKQNQEKEHQGKAKDQKDEQINYAYIKTAPYNLMALLSQYAIRDLENPDLAARVIKSLERGDLKKVTFAMSDGSERKMYIAAHPEQRTINLYNENIVQVRNRDYLMDALITSIKTSIQTEKENLTPIVQQKGAQDKPVSKTKAAPVAELPLVSGPAVAPAGTPVDAKAEDGVQPAKAELAQVDEKPGVPGQAIAPDVITIDIKPDAAPIDEKANSAAVDTTHGMMPGEMEHEAPFVDVNQTQLAFEEKGEVQEIDQQSNSTEKVVTAPVNIGKGKEKTLKAESTENLRPDAPRKPGRPRKDVQAQPGDNKQQKKTTNRAKRAAR